MLFEPMEGRKVRCNLCAHRCVIPPGEFGLCRVRENVAGALKTHSFANLVALNVDPIEKKPLFHFLPGTNSVSIAAAGCNFQCEFCQNWQISQSPRNGSGESHQAVSPEQVVAAAEKYKCASISYTYTEPTIFFEMAYETSRLAHERGILNCFVSNGYMTPTAVETIAPHLDAINVDLKAFRDSTYRRVMKARLDPVLACLRALVSAGVWVEVTTLVVPGMNDSSDELGDIAKFISGELGRHVPWHVTRFHGDYKMAGAPATPIETLQRACRIGADAGLKYVYCGNVPVLPASADGRADERTCCPGCGEVLIDRVGYSIGQVRISDGACPNCGERIEGVWKAAQD